MSASSMVLRRPPVPVAELVGRGPLCDDVVAQLQTARLVTLTGAGGSGKTRLALEVARCAAAAFPDGVAWVDLALLGDPDMVAGAVAGAFGVVERSGEVLPDTIVDALVVRRVLLLVDNCEHLADACAELLTTLLEGVPQLQVLATSRGALRVAGERSVPVPPLALPDREARSADAVRAADAARLFERRARAVRPGFRIEDDPVAVAEICRRLDGLPLALELAAARIGALSPAGIAAGLDDRFSLLTAGYRTAVPRHRTLEASVAWSSALLDHDQRLLLARLSVFAGTFDLDAVRAVAGADPIGDEAVLDLLAMLVEHSLVQVVKDDGDVRYRLLETIREHARGLLDELEAPAEVQRRHVEHYLALTLAVHQGLVGPEPQRWLERLDPELDELRVAMDRTLAAQRPSAAVSIAEAGLAYWQVRGLYAEVRRRLDRAVSSEAATGEVRARGLTTASILALMAGDFVDGHRCADEALHGLEDVVVGDPVGEVHVLEARARSFRAWCGYFAGTSDDATVTEDLDRAQELADAAGHVEVQGHVSLYGAVIELSRGDIAAGLGRLAAVRERMTSAALGYLLPAAHTWAGYGTAAMHAELAVASENADLGLRQAQQLDLQAFVTMAHSAASTVATLRGDEEAARRHLRAARGAAERRQLPTFVMIAARWEAFAAHRFDAPDAREAADRAYVTADTTGSAWDRTAAGWLRGATALRAGDLDAAAEAWHATREASTDPCYPFSLGRATLGLAELARRADEQDSAWGLAHGALDVLAEHGDRVGTADAIELVAELVAGRGHGVRALRLLGAADAFRSTSGVVRAPEEAAAWPRRLEAARHAAGDEADQALGAGWSVTLDEAVTQTRRGRGRRDRPTHGWDALTPAERAVVRLVGQGCSNRVIAGRLFVSINTIKTHLSSAYSKTNVGSREALAVEAAARLGDDP